MLAYRLGGGKGKIYLKLDLGPYEKDGNDLLMWKNMPLYLKIAHKIFKPLPDIYTVETKIGYERLKNTEYFYLPHAMKAMPSLLPRLHLCIII